MDRTRAARRLGIIVSAWLLLLSVAAVPIAWGYKSISFFSPSAGIFGDVPLVIWGVMLASLVTLVLLAVSFKKP